MEICKTNLAMDSGAAEAVCGPIVAGKRFHFIGVGGIGMSGLARLLLKNGAIVSGSDRSSGTVTDMLSRSGAGIKIGHHPANIDPKTDVVIISAAIKPDNPELQQARRIGCKVYKYAQMLGILMKSYQGIAVSGTHGKSTTSGWLAYCLARAGLKPSFIVGAEVPQLGGSSGVGEGRFFVTEACEYDRSFLNIKPRIAAILNIEQDHLDYYRGLEEIIEAFTDFARGIAPEGLLVANGGDANVAKVLNQVRGRIRCRTFGFEQCCSIHAENLRLEDGLYSFDVYRDGELLGRTRSSLPGKHNVLNALAVIAVANEVGLPSRQVLKLLPDFTGVDRRLTLKGRFGDVTILDDYAHHPTEIRASLQAIQQRYRPKRLWCIFQPHQYSRTRFLLEDFAESFKLADITIVPDIYFVRDSQKSKKQVNSEILVEKIKAKGSNAMFIPDFEQIGEYLKRAVAPGDLLVTMGAGDIWKVADEYIRWLRANS